MLPRNHPSCIILAAAVLAAGVAAQGTPVAYYPLDGNCDDRGPQQLHGTMVAGVTFVADRFGRPAMAANIASAAGSISLPMSRALDALGNRFTIGYWVRVQPGAAGGVVFDRDQVGTVPFDWNLGLTTSSTQGPGLFPYLLIGGSGSSNHTYYGQTPVDDGNWHHIAVQRDRQSDQDSGKVRFYVDGVLDGLVDSVPHDSNVSLSTSIGRNNSLMQSLMGDIDDLCLFDQLLSPSEIALLADTIPAGAAQFGTSQRDEGYTVAVDPAGDIVVLGSTLGSLDPGTPNQGGFDVYVAKWDGSLAGPGAAPLWVAMLGTAGEDVGYSVAVDSATGAVYVSGYTTGSFPQFTNAGSRDAFVAKLDGSGVVQWIVQEGGNGLDAARAVRVGPNGHLFVSGIGGTGLFGLTSAGSNDFFVARYDPSGNRQWGVLYGTSAYEDSAHLAVDGARDRLYVTGASFGSFPGYSNSGQDDIAVVQFDLAGNYLNCWQWGQSSREQGTGLEVDAVTGDVFVEIITTGSLYGPAMGSYDIAVARLDPTQPLPQAIRWGWQAGTADRDIAYGGLGVRSGWPTVVHVAGQTRGSFPGTANAGGEDVVVAEIDGAAGTTRALHQFGSAGNDAAGGPAVVDRFGDVWVVGTAGGALPGMPALGADDAFLVRYAEGGWLPYGDGGCAGGTLTLRGRGGYAGYALEFELGGLSTPGFALLFVDAWYAPAVFMPMTAPVPFACGELHVAPALTFFAGSTPSSMVVAGLSIPADPGMIGLGIAAQALGIDFSGGPPVQLSGAVAVMLR